MEFKILETVAMYLSRFLVVLIVLSVHEFFHAFAAVKNGDLTPKFYGRYTLNPIKHFDPLGLVFCVLVGFGWAKPVPINPNNFTNYKKGLVWTSIAGVLSNLAMAFVGYAFVLLYKLIPTPIVAETNALFLLGYMMGYYFVNFFYLFNLSLFIFNLIPLYPLDGFRLWEALDRNRGKVICFVRQYGNYILMALIFIHFLSDWMPLFAYVDILDYLMLFMQRIVAKPITLFWNTILGFVYG